MALTAKFVRKQLALFKPIITNASIESARAGQEKIGEILSVIHRKETVSEEHQFSNFKGLMIKPRETLRQGIMLYLHGGGYTAGNLDYAKGFGTVLASECGMPVFAIAYRLAPENKYPAAMDDAFEAYRYLINRGYSAKKIVLCGESAGGGLCFALCHRLKQMGMPMPGGVVAISPWTDLTMSGASYEYNKDVDPSMTKELLEFYAGCYADDRLDPCVSPLYGDLNGFPPSLIFAGGDEIMLEDAKMMHERLKKNGCASRLVVTPKMWHGYVLYCLQENISDFTAMDLFLGSISLPHKKLRWMRLDNAAKIYPAAKRKNWNNIFRISVTFNNEIDRDVLKAALDVTARRFPSIAVRLRRGVFWYYLEEIPTAPEIMDEEAFPLLKMSYKQIRKCAFRVLVYKKRMAVEFYHSLTDGTGALIFAKTLAAEYISQRYDVDVPNTDGVLSRIEEPDKAELEDSFIKNQGPVSLSRQEDDAFKITGTPEADGLLNLITLKVDADEIKLAAEHYGVSVTVFMCAVMIKAIINMQKGTVSKRKLKKPVKILIPVNLRPLFGSRTLRNFALYMNLGVIPAMGEYTLEELCKLVHHQMGAQLTAKQMQGKFTTNVANEKMLALRVMPLFIKNIAMKAVYNAVGERKACLCLSNMGLVKIPAEMEEHISRMDFVLGTQAQIHNNCGMLTYKGTTYINFTRNICEPKLEYNFFKVLQELDIAVTAESNEG